MLDWQFIEETTRGINKLNNRMHQVEKNNQDKY